MNDPNRTQMASAPTMDPNKTMMGTAPTLNATQTIKPVQCPVCKTFNPVGVMFCVECGLIFDRALPGDAFGAPVVKLPVLVDSAGREHILRPGEQVIGRQGDILIEDARLSRRHLRVWLDGEKVSIEEMGSTNGSTLDGSPITQGNPVELKPGQDLQLGGYELKLSMPGEAVKTAMPSGGRTAAIPAAPTVAAAAAELVGEGQTYPLKLGENTFGRKDENDIAIKDPYVSGRHGVIEVTADEVFVTDVGSTNGTILNDAKLAPDMRTKMGPDDVIKLGSLEFRVIRK